MAQHRGVMAPEEVQLLLELDVDESDAQDLLIAMTGVSAALLLMVEQASASCADSVLGQMRRILLQAVQE